MVALGGAVSMDRQWRRPRVDWWPQEEISQAQAYQVLDEGQADYMLTHDAPSTVDVPGLRDDWPRDVMRSANRHRELLSLVIDTVQPSVLFHGHMHVRHRGALKHPGGGCIVEGLGDNQGPFHENFMLVDLDAHGNVVLPL